jgi:hypothetical protein
MTMSHPPVAAETLLDLVLPVDTRDTVSGDLLEEYRDSRLPRLGGLRADLWYWRQVGYIWLRPYCRLVVPLLFAFVVHDLSNAVRTPAGTSYLTGLLTPIGWISRLVLPSSLLLAGMYGSRRTGRWAGGLVAALGIVGVMWIFAAVWWNATLYPLARVQETNPYWIHAWQWSTHRAQAPTFFGFNPDTPDETFLRWMFWDNVGGLIMIGFVLLAAAVLCGGFGSALGILMNRRRPAAGQRLTG